MNKTKFLLIVLMIMSFVSGSWAYDNTSLSNAVAYTENFTGSTSDTWNGGFTVSSISNVLTVYSTSTNTVTSVTDGSTSNRKVGAVALVINLNGATISSVQSIFQYVNVTTSYGTTSASTSSTVGMGIDASNKLIGYYNGSHWTTLTSSSAITDANDHVVIFTTGTDGGTIYIDGVSINATALKTNTTINGVQFASSFAQYIKKAYIFAGTVDASAITTALTPKTLSSIAISGSPTQTTYEAGDALNTAGLTVTGTYDDNSTETFTDGITWTLNPATLSAGATSCGVTATVSGVSSSEYTVTGLTVNASTKQTLYDNDASSSASSAHYYRIPAIAVDPSGNLYAYADYRTTPGYDIGGGDDGTTNHIDIQVRKSTDNGANWTSIATAVSGQAESSTNDFDYAHGDAAVVADREGKGFLMMSASGKVRFINSTTSAPIRVGRYTSTDGVTWTGSDVTSTIYGINFSTTVTGVFFSSGRICQSRYIKVGDYYRLYAALDAYNYDGTTRSAAGSIAVYSDDFGATWKQLGTSVPAASGDEAKIEELPNGNVLISSRMSGGRYFNIYTYTSKIDAKGAWVSSPTTSNSSTDGTYSQNCSANGEILIVPAKNSSNENCYVALQSIPKGGTTSGLSGRENLVVYYKVFSSKTDFDTPYDFASGWSLLKQINSTSSCYSTMVLDKNGDIAFIYEEGKTGEGYNIKFQTLSLSTLTSGAYTYSADVLTEANNNTYLGITTVDDLVGKTVTLNCNGYTSSESSTFNEYLYNNSDAIGTIADPSSLTASQYQFKVAKGFNGGYTFQSVSNTSLYLGVSTGKVTLESYPAEFLLTKQNNSTIYGSDGVEMDGYALQYYYPNDINTSGTDDGVRFVALKNVDGTVPDRVTYTCKTYGSYYSTDFTITSLGYTVTCNTPTNGTLTADPTTGVEAGTTVTFDYRANDGYELDALTVKDASNNDVTVTNKTFVMPASNVTITATYKEMDWTTTGSNTFHSNSWSVEGNYDGTGMTIPFTESWIGTGNTLPDQTISYKNSTGYTQGYYEVSILARMYNEGNTTDALSGTATFNANSSSVDMLSTGTAFTYGSNNGVYGTYTTIAQVGDDGTLNINFNLSGVNFDWIAFKDLNITYLGSGDYLVTCNSATHGTVTASSKTADENATVTLTATPATGYVLDTYTVTKTGDEATTVTVTDGSFTMPAYDVTVTATFKVSSTITPGDRPYAIQTAGGYYLDMTDAANVKLTTSAYPVKFLAGSTTGDWKIKSEAAGNYYLNAGETSTLGQTTTDVSTVYTWTIPGSNDAFTISRTDGKYIAAASDAEGTSLTCNNETGTSFKLVPLYIVWPETSANGSVGVSGYQSVLPGTTVQLTNTPADGYVLQSYTVTFTGSDNIDQTFVVSSEGKFEMPTADVHVTANFVKAYTVTCNTVTGGTVSATSTSAYEGETVTLTATPGSGYAFNGEYTVTDADGAAVTVTDGTFTMPASNVTVSATFVAAAYTITCETATGGKVTANTTGANKDDEITLTVTPNTNYALSALTVTDANGASVTVTDNKFTMPESSVTVSATFEKTSSRIFALKTTTTIDTNRKYLIVYQETANATEGTLMNSSFETNAGAANGSQGAAAGSTVTIADKTITTDVTNAFTISNSSTDGYYYIKNNAGYYFGNNSATPYFAVSNTAGIDDQISLSTTNAGFATIKSTYGTTSLGYTSVYTDPDTKATSTLNAFFFGGASQPYIYEEVVGYIITDASEAGGYITCDNTSVDAGTSVTLTVHPNGGYEFKTLTVDGTTVTPIGSADGTYIYTFTMPSHNVTVSSTYTGLYDGTAVLLKCIGYTSSSSFTEYLDVTSSSLSATSTPPASDTFCNYLFKITCKDGGYTFQSVSDPTKYLAISSNNLTLASEPTVLTFVKSGKASGNNVTPETMTGYALQFTGTGYSDDGIRFVAINQDGDIDHINYTSTSYVSSSDYFSSDFTMIIKYKLTWDQKNVHAYSIDLSDKTDTKMYDYDINGGHTFLGDLTNYTAGTTNSLIYVESDPTYDATKDNLVNVVVKGSNGNYTCSNLVLHDKVDVSIPYAFTAANATYERASTAKYGTIFFPYTPIKKEGYTYYVLTAKNLNDDNTGTLTFTSVDGDLAPNTPYFYKNTTGENFNLSTTNASVVVAANYPDPNVYTFDTDVTGWDMIGTYEKTTVFESTSHSKYASTTNNKVVDANSYYIKADGSGFAKVNGSFNGPSFRAYFSVDPSVVGAKLSLFSFVLDDFRPTDIIDVEDNGDGTVKVIYDLSGRKLREAQKGQVNIINGKKVFVK